MPAKFWRVLVVDRSAFMRNLVISVIDEDPEIFIAGQAHDGQEAVAMSSSADVLLFDADIDGVAEVRQLLSAARGRIRPVLLTADAEQVDPALDACVRLAGGATVLKPSGSVSLDIESIAPELIARIKGIPVPPPPSRRSSRLHSSFAVVAIGASTGGPRVLTTLCQELAEDFPAAVLIAQHMPARFTHSLADRLNHTCAISVKEAHDGDMVTPATVIFAPGDFHMRVERRTGASNVVRLRIDQGPRVHGVRPAADILLQSVAKVYGKAAVGVLLTGIGSDGVEGLRAIHEAGGVTIAQDEQSSVVFGMPGTAINSGVVDRVVAAGELAAVLQKIVAIRDPAAG